MLHRSLLLLHLAFQDARMHSSGIADAACVSCCRAKAGARAAPFYKVCKCSIETSALLWPSRNLHPLVDAFVVRLVLLLVAATARVPAQERMHLTRSALPLWSPLSRLHTPSLGLRFVTSQPTCHSAPFGYQRSENNWTKYRYTERGARRSHESRKAGTSRCFCSACGRLGHPATLDHQSVCFSRERHSFKLHRPTACGPHCPSAAVVVTKSRNNLVPSPPSFECVSTSERGTKPLLFLRLSRDCSHLWCRRTLFVTLCMRASHADVYSREPGGHVHGGSSRFAFTQSKNSGTWRSTSAYPPACSVSLCSEHKTAWCGLVLALQNCSKKSETGASPRRVAQHRASRQAAVLSILHCAFCSISVGGFLHGSGRRASALSPGTEHEGLLFWKATHGAVLQPAPLPQQTRSSIAALHKPCLEPLLGGTWSVTNTGAAHDDLSSFFVIGSRTCLVNFSNRIRTAPWRGHQREQISLRSLSQSHLRVTLQERTVLHTADVRHDGLVQVDGRPTRGFAEQIQTGLL